MAGKDLRFHRAVVRAARRFHVEGEIQRLARRALRQPLARRRNRQRALIDAQKTPVQPRRRDGRRAAARKQVADEVALLRRTAHDALQQLQRLLRFVSGALGIFLLQDG